VLGHLGCDTILEGGANNSEQHTASIFGVNVNKVRLHSAIANYDGQYYQLTSPVLLVKLSARKLVNTGPGQSNVTAMLLFNFSLRSASK
jgi:hypothetical protein